jgi:hypothetical protein
MVFPNFLIVYFINEILAYIFYLAWDGFELITFDRKSCNLTLQLTPHGSKLLLFNKFSCPLIINAKVLKIVTNELLNPKIGSCEM